MKNTDIFSLPVKEACKRYGLSPRRMRRIAAEAGALVCVGGPYIIILDKVEWYMDVCPVRPRKNV